MFKRINALLAALAIVCTCGSAGAEAMKKERVYVVTDAAGQVATVIDSVRLTNPEKESVITDRTRLSEIENVGGHETFTLDGEVLTWQADGSAIRYQGHGSEAPAIVPVVSYTLNGTQITDPSAASGSLTMQVEYRLQSDRPILAVTLIPVPEGMTDITLENAWLVDTGSSCYILGCAVPGADKTLDLPASFTVSCSCDHPELKWMLTAASSDPIALLCEKTSGDVTDTEALVGGLTAWLTALSNGTELPELPEELSELAAGIRDLLDGADALADGSAQLNTGAASLSDGAAQVKDGAARLADGSVSLEQGAAALEAGLNDLTANNDALNAGADQIFRAILAAANTQLSGLADAGIAVPELTADNYAGVLDGAAAQLNEQLEQGIAAAEAQVREAVMAQEAAVREGVAQAVRAKVLEGVLQAAGLDMTAAGYTSALQAGQIPAEQSAKITAAVDAQMASEETAAALEAAVQSAIDDLVTQNMAADEVQSVLKPRLEAAQAAIDSLNGLKDQLDQVNSFVTGLAAYTGGVSQAHAGSTDLHSGTIDLAAGADSLSTGAQTLSEGAAQLAGGAASLSDGASQLQTGLHEAVAKATDKAMPKLNEIQTYLDAFRSAEAACTAAEGYDLAADGMTVETVYIIRTELK